MFSETTSTGQRPSLFRAQPPARRPLASLCAGRTANYLTALLLAITALWCACWFIHARGYWEDDAWIHLEFARSVAEGHGFAFDGITVSADTAPLWVLLLAAMHALIPDWMAAGKLLAVLGALFGFSGIYAFSRRIARDMLRDTAADGFAAAIVLLTAANPYTCYWIFSGMETLTAAGLACWALVASTSNRPAAWTLLAGCALAGLAPLLRPEMLLLSPLLVWPLLRQLQRSNTGPSVRPLLLVCGALALTMPLAAWSLYSWHAFGYLLPSTVAAKRGAPGESVLLRLVKVYAFGLPLLLALAALLPLYLRRLRALPPAASIFLLWTVLSTVFYIANHTYVQTRYVLVTAPGLMAILLAMAFAARARTGRAMFAGALLWSAALSLMVVRPFLRNKAKACGASAEMASFIRQNVPADAPVAVYSIGEIAFLSRHVIVDTGGVTRPGALPYLYQPSSAVLRWAESEGAQYDIDGASPQPGALPLLTVPVAFTGWDLNPEHYRHSNPVTLWKLPPGAGATQQASVATDTEGP